MMGRPSKRERRMLARLRDEAAANDFISYHRARHAHEDRAIADAVARSAEHDRRCLEALAELERIP